MRVIRIVVVFIIAVILFFTTCTVAGCEANNENENRLVGMEVVSKREKPMGLGFVEYYVTLEKDNQSIELRFDYDDYRVMNEGLIVDVRYDSMYQAIDIRFPKLTDEKGRD